MTASELLHEAAKHESALYLTKREAADLSVYIRALEADNEALVEANAEWAETAAILRDQLDDASEKG